MFNFKNKDRYIRIKLYIDENSKISNDEIKSAIIQLSSDIKLKEFLCESQLQRQYRLFQPMYLDDD